MSPSDRILEIASKWTGADYVSRQKLDVDLMRSDGPLGQLFSWWLWHTTGNQLPSAEVDWPGLEAGGLDLDQIHLARFNRDAPERSQLVHCGRHAFENLGDNTGRSPTDFYDPIFGEAVIVDWSTAAYFSSPSYQRIEHTANGAPSSFRRLLLPLSNKSNEVSTHLLIGILPETPRRI